MAATVASLGSLWNTTAGSKTVTATPTANDLIVVVCASSGLAGGPTAVSDNNSDGLGTYTQVDVDRTGFSTTGVLCMWVRNALVGSASSTVFTSAQVGSSGGGLVVLRITGMSLTGASAVRSSGGQSTVASGTPAPVLSLTPLSSNPIITAMADGSNVTTNVVQRTGYTEDADLGYNTPATGIEVSHLASGETSATLTYGGAAASTFASIAIELAYNTAPTVALNAPADTATGVSTTPDLAFTGTDADSDTIEYEVQVDTVNTFVGVVDSYSESNKDFSIGVDSGSFQGLGQSFTGDGSIVGSAQFYLSAIGTLSGNMTAEIYAHTGTFGSGGNVTGSAIAVSDNLNAGTITSAGFSLFSFNFSGANQITLTNGTHYFVTIKYTNTGFPNSLSVGADNSSPTAAGNSSGWNGTSWSTSNTNISGRDICFYVNRGPLLDKLSVTPDATFTDVTNGAHTHPFPSGEQVKYTVQAGDTLIASTTYYWRVRGKDPSGTNTFGAWPTTRSFTTASGSTSASITQVAGTVTATGGTQAVSAVAMASAAVTQVAATVTSSGGTQVVQSKSSNAQVAANVTATGGTQTVASVQIASITQIAGTVTSTGGTQTIATVNNVSITQVAGSVTGTGGTQVIATINIVALAQLAGSVTASGGTQAVVGQTSATITQVAANVTASGGTQATIITVTQANASVTATGGTQTVTSVQLVAITQVVATVTSTGGTQSVATVNNGIVTQSAAAVTASGGTQLAQSNSTSTQIAANVTANGGTQSVASVNIVSISQVAATATASGGTQAIATIRNASVTQVGASVTASGGTQTIATINNVAITQVAGNVTASGGTQSLGSVLSSSVTQVSGTVTATGNTQVVASIQKVAINQSAANVTSTGGVQTIITNASITQTHATVTATGNTQAISSVNIVAISQSSASVTASGGTQTVTSVRDVSISQISATVTASGGAQSITAVIDAAIEQLAGQVTASGGLQDVTSNDFTFNISIDQIAAEITARGGDQSILGTHIGWYQKGNEAFANKHRPDWFTETEGSFSEPGSSAWYNKEETTWQQ